MAIKIYEQFAPFANPADGDYPYGSIKNDSIPGAEDGTPLDAVWANDYAGFDAELFAQAGIVPNGSADKLGASQRVDAIKQLEKAASNVTNVGGGSVQDFIDAQYTTVAELATGKFQSGQYVRLTDRSMGLFFVQSGGTANGSFLLNAGTGNTAILQTQGHKLTASSLGLVGGSDCTTTINVDLPQFIAANGITEIELDTGDIKISDTLAFGYGAVIFSKSQLLSTESNNADNMLQAFKTIRTDKKQFSGMFNTGAIYNNAIKTAISIKKEFKVVVFGDSIPVGSDYDSHGIQAGYVNATGVDNADRANSVSFQIYQLIRESLPRDVRIKFYSRCIGGMSYGQITSPWDSIGGLFSGREQATAGKSWRDCVLDLNPDLVIHAMGMNDDPTSYIDGLTNNWFNYLETEQKIGTFDQCIITTPVPNFASAEQFGDFRLYSLNASKHFVASNQRWAARNYGYSLIDVALLSNIKRCGFDTRACTFTSDYEVLTFKDGTVTKLIGTGSGVHNAEFTPNNLPIYTSSTFTINPSANSNFAGFDFKFVSGDIIVQFAEGNIYVYPSIYSASIGTIGATAVPYLLTSGVQYTFTVTITPTGILLYDESGNLLVHISEAPYKSTLPMRFENNASSAPVTLVAGIVRSAQFARYSADTLSDGEMYGKLNYTLNEFGGGINHPSSVGIVEIYMPPIREFLSEMTRSSLPQSGVVGGTAANEAVYIGRIAAVDYSVVTIRDYGSGIEVDLQIRVIAGVVSYNVFKNRGGIGVDIYVDINDLSVFAKNTTASILQFSYTGEWLSKTPRRLGVITPRGSLLSVV